MKRIILAVISILFVQLSVAQWSGMGAGPGGKVRALCSHGGTLYAGGDFTGLVKKWNGSSWVAVGTGLSGTKVNALMSFNGVLYAGGLFTMSASNFNVAKWNGSSWVSVGDGLAGVGGSEVKAFCIYNNVLYAGGTFTQSGMASVSKVAKLNGAGTAWSQVGGGAPPKCTAGVYAMAVYYNEFYVGGQGSAPWINKLNVGGTGWVELASGGLSAGTGIYALMSFKYPNQNAYSLFIGGDFASPFPTCCTYYSGSWGTSFNTFSGGVADQVNCFAASSAGAVGNIYAGGVFTVNGVANLAKKPISGPWAAEGTNPFNGSVNAMCFFSGYLVAGGDFTSPGTNVARFATTIDVEEVNENILVNQVYPNPVIRESLLKVQTKNSLTRPELRMMDVSGKTITARTSLSVFNRSHNEIEFRIDREGLASGIYFYHVVDEERTVATGKIMVE